MSNLFKKIASIFKKKNKEDENALREMALALGRDDIQYATVGEEIAEKTPVVEEVKEEPVVKKAPAKKTTAKKPTAKKTTKKTVKKTPAKKPAVKKAAPVKKASAKKPAAKKSKK